MSRTSADVHLECLTICCCTQVDPPSLALIMPILKRGLQDRAPSTKKMACQVVGSICSLIQDVQDIKPYAKMLLKQLKENLVDPIPEVRGVASKAMGQLYKGR